MFGAQAGSDAAEDREECAGVRAMPEDEGVGVDGPEEAEAEEEDAAAEEEACTLLGVRTEGSVERRACTVGVRE